MMLWFDGARSWSDTGIRVCGISIPRVRNVEVMDTDNR